MAKRKLVIKYDRTAGDIPYLIYGLNSNTNPVKFVFEINKNTEQKFQLCKENISAIINDKKVSFPLFAEITADNNEPIRLIINKLSNPIKKQGLLFEVENFQILYPKYKKFQYILFIPENHILRANLLDIIPEKILESTPELLEPKYIKPFPIFSFDCW